MLNTSVFCFSKYNNGLNAANLQNNVKTVLMPICIHKNIARQISFNLWCEQGISISYWLYEYSAWLQQEP